METNELHDAHVWEWVRECWVRVENGWYITDGRTIQTLADDGTRDVIR
jgi:hypothetical protein